jgi:CRP-like cAMP-binding protein
MDNFLRRINQYVEVDSQYFEDLGRLPHRIEMREAGQEIVTEGESIDFVFVIEEGWAIRFRMLEDGRRQILNFMLPGDCFDLMSLNKARSDHSVLAATPVNLRRIKSDLFLKTVAQNPSLATSFWWAAIQEEAILREQIVRVGRKSAKERLGHLILELNRRVAAVTGQLDDHLSMPVPQSILADALGLSVVHISRSLTRLKSEGLIEVTKTGFKILDRDALAEMCDFDSRYLHLDKLKL